MNALGLAFWPAWAWPFSAFLLCVGLSVVALCRDANHQSRWFCIGMMVFGLEFILAALSGYATATEAVKWYRLRIAAMSLVPGVWTWFTLVYARADHQRYLARWRLVLATGFLVPIAIAAFFYPSLVREVVHHDTRVTFALGAPAEWLHALLIVYAVFMLMHLEAILRSAVGSQRWRVKYLVFGVGTLLVFRIYTSSQALLYQQATLAMDYLNAGGLVVGGALIFRSMLRSGTFRTDLYFSHHLLFRSTLVLLIGCYLLIVGLLAKLVAPFGGESSFPIKAMLVLVAIVLLSVALNSDRLRQRIHHVVNTHFRRPHYDYRQVWSEFDRRTTNRANPIEYCRESVAFLADTFEALSVSVWHRSERGALVLGGTLDGTDKSAARLSAAKSDQMLAGLQTCSGPVDLDDLGQNWAEDLRALCPSKFENGGHRYAVPLKPLDDVTGVLLIGDRVSGIPFTTDDFELLGVISGNIASDLLNMELSEKMVEHREMQAFQNLSTFFIHDLKNTASTLSLLLRNLREHFDDPAFREDALRSFGRSVETINELIERLTLLRQGDRPAPVTADLNRLVDEALEPLAGTAGATIKHRSGPPCLVRADPRLLHTVVANLVVNAREAGGEEVRVAVEIDRDGPWAVITVQDDGCGMSPEFLESQLFRPFKTTKKGGLGIGLFHTRSIVEEHQGRIEVESEEGDGTTFRILLPLHGEGS